MRIYSSWLNYRVRGGILFKLRDATEGDFESLVKVYNSNESFLQSHLGVNAVDLEWLTSEFKQMLNSGFQPLVAVDKDDVIIGLIDYKDGSEIYLSLLMLDSCQLSIGIGRRIYEAFENEYCYDSKSIRMDLVSNYNVGVEHFWKSNGFKIVERLKLEWNGRELDAMKMKKYL